MAASEIADPVAAMRSTYFINYSDAFAEQWDSVLVERALQQRAPPLHSRRSRAARFTPCRTTTRPAGSARSRQPTLVAHGTDDGTVPVENGRFLAERIPEAHLRLYQGGRHLFFTECAERLNHDIIEFLGASPFTTAK